MRFPPAIIPLLLVSIHAGCGAPAGDDTGTTEAPSAGAGGVAGAGATGKAGAAGLSVGGQSAAGAGQAGEAGQGAGGKAGSGAGGVSAGGPSGGPASGAGGAGAAGKDAVGQGAAGGAAGGGASGKGGAGAGGDAGQSQGGAGAGGDAASCMDGLKNGDELDVDCGGSCPPCADGKFCKLDTDCQSASCGAGHCAPTTLATALLDGSTPRPLYPVTAAGGPRAVAFRSSGTLLEATDEQGASLWKNDVGQGALFGGFDFDGDGQVDVGLVRSEATGQVCGQQPRLRTRLDLVNGKTGAVIPFASPLDDLCWDFGGGVVYPTQQWTSLAPLFGAGKTLAAAPYYATQGNFLSWNGGGFADLGAYIYPSTASFDASYPAAQPNAYANGQSFITSSHVGNGLIVTLQGQERLVFFTSGRVVQYAVGPLGPAQLLVDSPFLTGGRTDIAGRDYGLVTVDPGAPGQIALIAGTSATTMQIDMKAGTMTADPWGQIERHVTRYDLGSGAVEDRFFSYAHDGGDADKYEGRVLYPAGALVRVAGPASRLAFNVYAGGRWSLHVTVPGGTADALTLKDLFLWDIRDLDGDGQDEWVVSPAHDPQDPDVPGFYFLKWRTLFGHWNEASLSLALGAPHEGLLPELVPRFRAPTTSTSMGGLDTVSTVRSGGTLQVLMRTPENVLQPLPVTQL